MKTRKFKVKDLLSNPYLPGLSPYMIAGVDAPANLAEIRAGPIDLVSEATLIQDLVESEREFELIYPSWIQRPSTLGQFRPVVTTIGDHERSVIDLRSTELKGANPALYEGLGRYNPSPSYRGLLEAMHLLPREGLMPMTFADFAMLCRSGITGFPSLAPQGVTTKLLFPLTADNGHVNQVSEHVVILECVDGEEPRFRAEHAIKNVCLFEGKTHVASLCWDFNAPVLAA